MNSIGSTLAGYQIKVPQGKHKFEYQELCTQLEKYWGKRVWMLPHRSGFTENRIRHAARECWKMKKVGPQYFGYLFAVIRNSKIR